VHGQEFNSFRRKTRSKVLHEFKLHRQEKFLYVCDTLKDKKGTGQIRGKSERRRDWNGHRACKASSSEEGEGFY